MKRVIMWLFIMVSFVCMARADSGAQAYCKCQRLNSLAACNACCKLDCHNTNWGGDFFGICTARCQKSCSLYNDPSLSAGITPAQACSVLTQVPFYP